MINWNVTEQEADFILSVVGTRPYNEVNQLIAKLVAQANPPKPPLTAEDPDPEDW